MDHEELRKLLGLKPVEHPTTKAPMQEEELEEEDLEAEEEEPSESALKLDRWDIARGENVWMKSPHSKKINSLGMADFFQAAFGTDPELNQSCLDAKRHAFLKALMETPDYRTLHTNTMLNVFESETAANQFVESFLKYKEEKEQREKHSSSGTKPGRWQPGKEGQEEGLLLLAVAHAAREAKEDVEKMEEACEMCGHGPGSPSKKLDTKEVSKVFRRVKDSAMIREVFNRTGKLRTYAQARQRLKINHGQDDMVGIELGGDLAKLVPVELALLADEDFEMDAMRRLVERQMMQKEMRGVKKVGKGPVVIVTDGSQSMETNGKIYDAKAFALVMAWLAQAQGRWCCLVEFGSAWEGNRLVLPPGKWDENKVLDWTEHWFRGGTEAHIPLEILPFQWWNEMVAEGLVRGKTDMVIQTDGLIEVSTEMKNNFLEWKKREQVRVTTLVIQGHPGGLAEISDECHRVSGITLAEKAIGDCLAI